MGTPALYMASNEVVEVIHEREELSYVKFPDGKCIWVKNITLDFDDPHPDQDDDWGNENDDQMGFDSPTDFDEHEMNPDDCLADAGDQYDIEYDR